MTGRFSRFHISQNCPIQLTVMRRLCADLSIVCKEGEDKQLLKLADHVAQKKKTFIIFPFHGRRIWESHSVKNNIYLWINNWVICEDVLFLDWRFLWLVNPNLKTDTSSKPESFFCRLSQKEKQNKTKPQSEAFQCAAELTWAAAFAFRQVVWSHQRGQGEFSAPFVLAHHCLHQLIWSST